MNIVVEKHPKCMATLRVEVGAEQVARMRASIVDTFAGQARLPGFRPGKVPRKVIEQRFRLEIGQELDERLVREGFEEALRREDLRVLDFGAPKSPRHHPDGVFSFSSELVLAPDFELPEYKGIEIEVPRVVVTDEMVEEQLGRLRERFAEFSDIDDRPAAEGDYAVIDFTSTLDGQPLEEAIGRPAGFLGGRADYWLKLDPEVFLPGFAAGLAGMRPGDERDLTLPVPDDFPLAAVRGRELVFHVKLTGLKQQQLPEFDDALADKLLPGRTLAEVRDTIRAGIQDDLGQRLGEFKVDRVVEHLNRQVSFELPERLLTSEIQGQADALVERGVRAGMSEDEISSQQGEIFNAAGRQARLNLRTHFILQEIARAENLEVSDRELLVHLADVARRRRQPLKKLVSELRHANRMPAIRNSLLVGKAIDFLVAQAIVREIEPPEPSELPEQPEQPELPELPEQSEQSEPPEQIGQPEPDGPAAAVEPTPSAADE